MKPTERLRAFLDVFLPWAVEQPDVHGIALVGSYAREEARDDSDIDLVILTDLPRKYLDDVKWIERFGIPERHQTEDYGRLTSMHVWYQKGVEVEYGITTPDWAAVPLDAGTRDVMRRGIQVLFERGDLLSRHVNV
ncbi:MAG TPA: nucleotidyltransferase domain-containing protein [Anaerolineales bacterium]|jgi:predicted nucleotidyltransferase|nr:nucleotidyltransferase domain-containing protein [Anaerolineales bacterium]